MLDGARFDDLPSTLGQCRLSARSLVLDRADEEVRKAGPWLIDLNQGPDALGVLRSAIGKTDFVGWRCELGELILFRHLRTLAVVVLPDGDRVFFRHFDPQIMVLMASNLEAGQETDLYGPAEEIMIFDRSFSRDAVQIRDRGTRS